MDVLNIFRLTFLGIVLCFNGIECTCYTNYQQCYTTYSNVPRPQSPSDDWDTFCNATNTLDTCLKNDVTTCAPGTSPAMNYNNYVAIADDSKRSCRLISCTKIQLQCASIMTNATSLITTGSTPEGFASYCEALPTVKKCYSNYVEQCNEPELMTGINEIMKGIDDQLLNCQKPMPGGECMTKALECANITMGLMPSGDPSAILQQIGAMCPVLGQLKECYNGLIADCPSLAENANAALNSFQMAEQFCGDGLDKCVTKMQECAGPMAAYPNCSDLENVGKLSLAEGVNCCKLSADTTKCLQDSGCGMLVSSNPALQQSEALCQGYNDYCPQMFDCFNATYSSGGFTNAAAVCRNVGGFITCIEEKCANKPQIGQQSLAKIKEVFSGICGVLVKYPTVGSCTNFTSCIEQTPSLPGTVERSLQSFISARDTDRWCQIAKSYVGCGETAATSCNLGATFTTDVSATKTSTDQACTGVRGPCLPVSNCLSTLMGNQTEMTFRTTCPNIPAFVTCTDNALTTCGEGSRVKADYSLDDVKNLYVETCDATTDELYQCNLMRTCLDLQLPLNAGDMIDEFSDQTSWCRKLNRMVKCTADVSISCRQPKDVQDKFMMLYHKVSKHCPSPNYQPPKPATTPGSTVNDGDGNGAGAIRVTGVLFMTVFLMIFI